MRVNCINLQLIGENFPFYIQSHYYFIIEIINAKISQYISNNIINGIPVSHSELKEWVWSYVKFYSVH